MSKNNGFRPYLEGLPIPGQVGFFQKEEGFYNFSIRTENVVAFYGNARTGYHSNSGAYRFNDKDGKLLFYLTRDDCMQLIRTGFLYVSFKCIADGCPAFALLHSADPW